jgi:menaquinol-cytochrome c reductase iron-sulfur subunit
MATQRATLAGVSEGESGKLAALVGRRSFLAMLFSTVGAAFAAVCALPFARYIAYPLYAAGSHSHWVDAGPVSDFTSTSEPVRKLINIEHLDGWQQTVSQQAVYVTRDAGGAFVALSSVCPHLGCSVAWQSNSKTFVCPCHGGCFAPDGSRISGPPPRRMSALPTRIDGGRLSILPPSA